MKTTELNAQNVETEWQRFIQQHPHTLKAEDGEGNE